MKAILIGYKEMKGTSKKTGKPYDAKLCHLGYEDKFFVGTACTELYVPTSILENSGIKLEIGATYDFIFDVNFNGFKTLVGVQECQD